MEEWRFSTLFIAAFLCAFSEARIEGFRSRRQTVVLSNAEANGTADVVDTSALSHHFKTVDGTIGVNVSSTGNATGADAAGINNNAFGSVGDDSVFGQASATAQGALSKSFSDIYGQIFGENMSLSSYQQASGNGVGDTSASATGSNIIEKAGVPSNYSGTQSQATAGATGSLASSSEVVNSQVLSWESILAQLVGSSVAQGLDHAQANVDLGAGNAVNGISLNGLVSGTNSGGDGQVNAQVNGNGLMVNEVRELTGNLYGFANGTNSSSLVGASNLQSNSSGEGTSISTFGDSKVNTNGQSESSLIAQAGVNPSVGTVGDVSVNGSASGSINNVTVSNGLQVNDANGNTIAIGNGAVQGVGTENSQASMMTDTKYNGGDASVVVNGDGTAAAINQTSALDIAAKGQLVNSNGLDNSGFASAAGMVNGEFNNLTGNSFLNIDSAGANGNTMMNAQGGGAGPSSALTAGTLQLNDPSGDKRNMTVQGSVSATGDQTFVFSSSVITDYAGMQSLSNYQNATSKSAGSSSASASNVGIFKRRKRDDINARILSEITQ